MRTRSQPLSPGGLVQLEENKPSTRQTTRSMRMKAANNSVQSASQSSQDDSQQPQPEPTQSMTRSTRNQKNTNKKAADAQKSAPAKKTTTTKKATTAKKTATTKRAAAARKTDTTAKVPAKPAKAPAKRAANTRAGRKMAKKAAEETPEDEEPEVFHDASESPEPESYIPASQSTIPDGENNEEGPKATSAVEVLLEPKTSDCQSSRSSLNPSRTQESSAACSQETEPTSFGPSEKSKPWKTRQTQRLTAVAVNRKRARADSTESEQEHETPISKRRTMFPPRTTSALARRLGSLSRRLSTTAVPYAERLRRRQAERQGRIHTTVFRLPELVAQTEADRRASETAPSSPCPPAPQNSFDYSHMSPSQPSESSTPQPPRTPETPRGWNIRGLLGSVPRSFSRLLPSFGRSPARNEQLANETGPSTPSAPSDAHPPTPATVGAPTNAQSSERTGTTPKRVSAKQPDLSYSLFPRRIDRSLYLPPAPPSLAAGSDSTEKRESQEQPQEQTREEATSEAVATPSEERPSREISVNSEKKKRKRAPSPDVIPNPPGCSYGMNMDYFCYSDSDDEEMEDDGTPIISQPTPLAKSTVRSVLQSEAHPSKKVRFDASPEDTPSKLRGRATDPYNGRTFVGMRDSSPSMAPPPPPPAAPNAATPSQRPPGFQFNYEGSFGFDYDDFSDDSTSTTSSAPSSPSSVAPSPTSSLPEDRTTVRGQTQESAPPAPHPRLPAAPPSTPIAKVDTEALAKVRSQAEKYKPKTPSGLRTASRYSTSPMVASPDNTLAKQEPESIGQQLAEKHSLGKENQSEEPSTPVKPAEEFGDDQFARDAKWLYENCPSGDLSKFAWPEKRSLVDSLGIDRDAEKILNDVFDKSDFDDGHSAFRRGMEEFAATLA